jgi:DNA-binding transcriptional LysR family regulator
MNLLRLDLNLLVVFHHLYLQKKVSLVAQVLGMSQPAVSSALGRLRSHLGDDLFVRTQMGMEPTTYAQTLAAPIANAIDILQQAFDVRAAFDPRANHREFTVAMTDVGEMYFLPILVDALNQGAPYVTLQVQQVSHPSLKDDMASGKIDLAMGLLPQLQGGFFQQGLFRQKYVCLMRQAHPLATKKKLSLPSFAAAEHVRVIAEGTGHGRVDVALEKQKLGRQFRLTVPHYVALGDVLRHSDLVATVPERFADRIIGPYKLVKRNLPLEIGESSIHQFWHGRLHRDPGHQWLRQLNSQLFGDGAGFREEKPV